MNNMENRDLTITLNFTQDNDEYSNTLINTLLVCDKKRNEAEKLLNKKIGEFKQALADQETELNKKHKEDKEKALTDQETEWKNKLLNRIKQELDEIVNMLKNRVEDCNNVELKKYVMEIINQSIGGWRNCESIDKFIYNCTLGSNAVCRIANLIWWNRQENCRYIVSELGDIDEIEKKMQLVCVIVELLDYSIKIPDCSFGNAIEGYKRYDDERSNFIDIFKDEQCGDGTLCEIRFFSIDGKEGKMYGYYK